MVRQAHQPLTNRSPTELRQPEPACTELAEVSKANLGYIKVLSAIVKRIPQKFKLPYLSLTTFLQLAVLVQKIVLIQIIVLDWLIVRRVAGVVQP